MDTPANWRHKSGYRLNADGKSIEYEHIDRQLLAIVEAMVNETDDCMEYYAVVFDVDATPWRPVEGHELFRSKEAAKTRLREWMGDYE